MFGGMRLKSQPDGFSVSTIFERLFTEELTGTGKDIFEGSFKFSDSDARTNFDSTDFLEQGAIGGQPGSRF